jgi:thioredoxin-related protein
VSVFQYLERPQEGMKEAQRVLQENGSFTTLDYNPKCYASVLGLVDSEHKEDKLIDEHLYKKMSKENIRKWMKEAVFSDTKIENFLYLPGFLPIAHFASRAINSLIKRIPFINEFSIMLLTTAKKRKDIDH